MSVYWDSHDWVNRRKSMESVKFVSFDDYLNFTLGNPATSPVPKLDGAAAVTQCYVHIQLWGDWQRLVWKRKNERRLKSVLEKKTELFCLIAKNLFLPLVTPISIVNPSLHHNFHFPGKIISLDVEDPEDFQRRFIIRPPRTVSTTVCALRLHQYLYQLIQISRIHAPMKL